MGILTLLRQKNPDHSERVNKMVEYRKFENPTKLGDKKWLRVVKPIYYEDSIKAFVMNVDNITPVINDQGTTEYLTLDKGLRFSLSKNMAIQFEGKTRIRLLTKDLEPDEDLRCTQNSIWETRADAIPDGSPGKGLGKDYMINMTLLSLNEGIIHSLNDSKTREESRTNENTSEEGNETAAETDAGPM
jgi:hypothetical protein